MNKVAAFAAPASGAERIGSDSLVWLAGAACQLFRIPCDPHLLLRQFPPPHARTALLEALQMLGFRAAFKPLTLQALVGLSAPAFLAVADGGPTSRQTSWLFTFVFPFFHHHPEVTMFSLPTSNAFLRLMLPFALLGMSAGPALAQSKAPAKNEVEAARQQGYSVKTITRIFDQLLMFSYPRGFKPAFEDARGGQYIQESVLDGESTKKWSQMLTITGAKGLASNPNVSPQVFANKMAGGFKNACPSSFSGAALGALKIGTHDAFAAVISCGVANTAGAAYSESMLLVVVKGQSDYYTIQWAERGAASTSPIRLDDAKWQGRLKQLAPIKLCPIVPGEAAPYPSCVERA